MIKMRYIPIVIIAFFILGNACKKSSSDTPFIIKQVFYIDENSPNGTLVGIAVAVDKNAKKILFYKIIDGNTDNAFRIDSITGKIFVNNSNALDYEKDSLFTLILEVMNDSVSFRSDSTEVIIHLNNEVIPKNGLVSYFPFNGTIKDIIDTLAVIDSYNMNFNTDRFNVPNNACDFSGSYSWIRDSSRNFDFPQRTVSLWFKAANNSKNVYGVMYCSDNPYLKYGCTILSLRQNGTSFWLIFNVSDIPDSVSITQGVWNNATITVNNDTANYFLNNNLISTKILPSSKKSNDGNPFMYLGIDFPIATNNYYTGLIDDLYIYNRALSNKEVLILFKEQYFPQQASR